MIQNMKQKIFSLLALLMTAVTGAWAAKDVVPSDAVLSDYYDPGDVCVCIYVPAEMNCNDIVLAGSFNGWSTTVASLPHFEPVEGYDGWYVASFEPEAEPDPEKGVQAKPVMLQNGGDFNWDYQVGAATAIRGGVQVVQGAYAGEIDLINYGADAPNVFTVDAWKQNPCTAIYHNYIFTVVSDGCGGLAVPFLVGAMTNWEFRQMQLDMAKTQQNQAPTYFINITAAEGAPYQIVSGLMNEGGEITVQPAWADDAYMQKLVNNEWVRIPGEDGDNLLTKEDPNIVWDLRADDLRWARGASAANGFKLSVGENAHGTVKFYVGENEVTSAAEGATVNVVVTPATGWVVNKPSGQWYAAVAKAPRRTQGDIGLQQAFDLTAVEGQTNTWSFVMDRANAEVSVSYKKLLTHTDITIDDITAPTYTGQALEPTVSVKDGSTVLTLGTDYTVAYSNNTNAALSTATENAPTVTITAVATSEKYAGETTKKFTINKADITPTAPVAKTGLVYTAEAQELITAGSIVGAGNMEACTMKYSLDGTNYATTIPTGTNAKEYTVYYKVDADANHNDVAAQNFKVTITAATLTEATLKDTLFIFNPFGAKPQTAEVDVVKAGELIVPATDYTVSDDTQTDLGDYQLTVTGKNNFQGIVKANFHIVKDDLPVTAEDTESGEEVDNVTIQISVETDTETGEKTVIVDQLDVTPATSSQQVTVEIPSRINGVPVASIAGGALVNATNVSDIYMPETGETAIEVTDGALEAGDGKAVIHAPLQLLDNYAKMLPGHVGEKKVVSDVKQTTKRFWTFSCGVDVTLPAGVTANIVKANTENQVISEPISGNTVKANNGVLLEGEQGVEYQITALPASSVGNDYAGNLLEPVVEKKHYGYGQGYYILDDGKFYAIANDASAIGSCKAVLHIAGANARVISIYSDDATAVEKLKNSRIEELNGNWYDLSGRKLQSVPTKKGVYLFNGRKVVVVK